jgi:dTDP-4-amino-4,6-dideoxygalactose transaminase
LEIRQGIAKSYIDGLNGIVEVPFIPEGLISAWAQYSIMTDRRQEVQANLGKQKIPTAIYYPTPLHRQPAFSYLGYREGDCPIAEATAGRILSLPMHPYLKDTEIAQIVEGVRKALLG